MAGSPDRPRRDEAGGMTVLLLGVGAFLLVLAVGGAIADRWPE